MGWWEIEDGLVVGDGPLDECEQVLERVSEEYREGQGRKPSLRELLACFALVLRSRAEDFVGDTDEIIITDVVARTKKRPKKPCLRPGDIFSVPLGSGEYAFGRLTPQDGLVDFFEIKTSVSLRTSRLKNIKTFRLPGLVMLDPLLDARWKILDRLPYSKEEFRIQPFKVGGKIACGQEVVNGFIDPSSNLRAAAPEELTNLPELSLWTPELVEEKLRERLG